MQSSEIIAEIAVELLDQDSFDNRVNKVLQIIGHYFGVSKALVFLDRPGGAITDNTHEWFSLGNKAPRAKLQGIEYSSIQSMT